MLSVRRGSLHALAIDACLEEVGKEVMVSKGIIGGFTGNEYLHSSWIHTLEQRESSGSHYAYRK